MPIVHEKSTIGSRSMWTRSHFHMKAAEARQTNRPERQQGGFLIQPGTRCTTRARATHLAAALQTPSLPGSGSDERGNSYLFASGGLLQPNYERVLAPGTTGKTDPFFF